MKVTTVLTAVLFVSMLMWDGNGFSDGQFAGGGGGTRGREGGREEAGREGGRRGREDGGEVGGRDGGR